MNRLRIEKIRLKNFKGIDQFEVFPNGEDITLHGDNASGKTTIADAFFWGIWGKDSAGKANFQLKPLGDTGEEIHNLDTEVELGLTLDGQPLVLMKRFKEDWIRKRGSTRKEFTGHTTDYFIDGVPSKKKEYDDKIKSIIDDAIFRLLANPLEFNLIKWQDRRAILMQICGDVDDSDVVEADAALAPLQSILNGCPIDDHKKKVQAKKRDINKELEQIPARIDELKSAIQAIEQPDLKEKARLKKTLDECTAELKSLTDNTAISEKEVRINEIESEILKTRNAAPDVIALRKPILDDIASFESKCREKVAQIETLEHDIDKEQKRLLINNDAVEKIRKRWYTENEKAFTHSGTCPTCGQDIPEDQMKETEERFNAKKAEELAKITAEGKEQANAAATRAKTIKDETAQVKALSAEIEKLDKAINAKKDEVEAIVPQVDQDTIDSLTKQKNVLRMEIDALKNGSSVKSQDLEKKIEAIETDLEIIAGQEAEVKAGEKSQKRIEELEDREKALAKEFESLEQELFLIEKFVVTKVNLLEGKINSKFKMARFKLFSELLNGGLSECCETLCGGVPYNHGLNTGARINTGIDIINTLSDHYGFQCPIFVDNSESITNIIDTDSQLIRLVVDPNHKKLTQLEI